MRSENALKWKLDNILHWNKFTQNQAIKRWLCKNQVHNESANWVTFFTMIIARFRFDYIASYYLGL